MSRTATIPWGAFGNKHKRYIRNAQVARMAVAEGAIRSGKTIDHCILAAMYLETTPDKFHLATGSTIGNAKLNIGVCNGFGLEALFRGRCKWGKYRDNEALFLNTQTGQKIVIFAGGAKADSYKRILGNSYGLWIATEINEHYDSADSRTSFIKVALGRQIAAVKPYTLWDLNPCYPEHPIYTDYIEPWRKAFEGGFCYGHFTLRDNATITPERLAEILSRYKPGTVWRRRDIDGERCVAEGLCFPYYADDPAAYAIKDAAADGLPFTKKVIGIDFGGNGSKTTMGLTGYQKYDKLIPLAENSLPITDKIDAAAICDSFVAFYRDTITRYGKIDWVLYDSASPTMGNSLVSAAKAAGLPWRNIRGCRKNEVSQRPRTVDRLLTTGRLQIAERCTETRRALSNLRWDEKKPDQPEDKNIGNINDWWDEFCYTWLDFVEFIDRRQPMNETITAFLKGLGYDTSATAQGILAECEEWYRNSEKTKHSRVSITGETQQLLHMGFGKRVCSDDASLCEVVEVNAGGENQKQFEAVNALLEANQFDTMYRRQLEHCSALGTVACYVRLEGAEVFEDGAGVQTLKGGKVKLNYVDGLGFCPLTVENGEVHEAAFAGTELINGKAKTTLVVCTVNGGIYSYRTVVFNDTNQTASDQTVILGNVKPFAVLRTAEVNNIAGMTGYGLPKLHNAIPVLLALDTAWTGLFGDIDTCDKIVLLNELLCGFDEDGTPITPNQQLKKRFVMLGGDKLPDQKTLSQEITPEIRVEKFREVIELLLSMLSMMFGYGLKKYKFEGGQITTATEYVGERQDELQDLNKQRAEAETYIQDIIRAALWFMNTFQGTKWDEKVDISVEFNDSYITDKASRLLEMRNDILAGIGGPYVLELYLKEKYNLSDEEAKQWAGSEPAEDDATPPAA